MHDQRTKQEQCGCWPSKTTYADDCNHDTLAECLAPIDDTNGDRKCHWGPEEFQECVNMEYSYFE